MFDLLLQPIQGMSGAAPVRPIHHHSHQLRVAVKVINEARSPISALIIE